MEKRLECGDNVRVYYHANDHPLGYRYCRLIDGDESCKVYDASVVGLSSGWMPATIKETPTGGKVLVSLHGWFADVYRKDGQPAVNGMYWKVDCTTHVRPMDSPMSAEISLLVVRWWDYWNNRTGSRSHSVANERMLLDALEGPNSIDEALRPSGKYEVYSAFIKSSDDLAKIGDVVANSMKAPRRSAMYFLWPVQKPATERSMAGAVSERSMFDLMERMESSGVHTCWPHPSKLYRQMAGKLWIEPVSQRQPEMRVPMTVRIDSSEADTDAKADSAASAAIARLRQLQKERDGRESAEPFRGVVKLGFSWCGAEVRPFSGPDELSKVLQHMLLNGPPETVCLIQERIENVVGEFRLICCRDRAKGEEAVSWEVVRMRQKPGKHGFLDSSFTLASHDALPPQEAAVQMFGGDKIALAAAETEVRRLGELWLKWFVAEGYGAPGPAFRLDFLVVKSGSGLHRPDVWTVELCECGGSMCGLEHGPRTAAFLNQCLAVPIANSNGNHKGDAGCGIAPIPLPVWRVTEKHGPLKNVDASKGPTRVNGRNRPSPSNNGRKQSLQEQILALLRRPALWAFLSLIFLNKLRANRWRMIRR